MSHRQLSCKASLKSSNQCSKEENVYCCFHLGKQPGLNSHVRDLVKSPELSPVEGGLAYNNDRGDLVVPFRVKVRTCAMISATVYITSSQNTTFIFLLNVLFELDLFNLAAFF